MDETTPLQNSEHRSENTYPFLTTLAADHPELAKSISDTIPQWREWMNTHIQHPKATEAILNSIDYISLEEMAQIIQDWGKEIVKVLTENPERKIVILSGVGGSQQYFAQKVYQQIPENLQSRVSVDEGENRNRLGAMTRDFDSFIKTDFYLFDDSINSGQQVSGMVFPDIFHLARKLEENALENDH
jgi:hypothetical protein